jgi:hypothetical protein
MATAQTSNHASTIGAMAAGKLLAKATGGRLWPTLLILAGIVLVRRYIDAQATKKAHAKALLEAPD